MKLNLLFTGLMLFTLFSFAPIGHYGLADEVYQHTNRFRKSRGLPALQINEALNAIAQKHSEDMAKGKVGFGHSGFANRDAQARRKITGINSFAENVAYGPTTGKEVVNRWKTSSGHRKNMLGRFKYIGIGISKDRRGRIYYTQVFAG